MRKKKTPVELNVFKIECGRNNYGKLTCFVKLSGCNLKCSWCNEPNALTGGTLMPVNDVLLKVKECPATNVCITGGEPLLQFDAVEELASLLVEEKKDFVVETNGTVDWSKGSGVFKFGKFCLDLKPPSSGMEKFNNYDLIKKLGEGDRISVVVQNKRDYDFVENLLNFYKPVCEVVVRPCGGVYARNLWRWVEREPRVRLELDLRRTVFGV